MTPPTRSFITSQSRPTDGHSRQVGISSLLLGELAPLDPIEHGTVEAAAVLGDHATTDLVAALTGSPVPDVVESLNAVC
ncbi:hypothetical protein [Streptomyces sp. TE33382]